MSNRIGRYEIQVELGRGGFGRVFRAYDPTVGRLVAIKTLNASCEPDMLARFRNEAAAAGRLHHPNIVTVFDFGEHDGSPFLVMELIDGEDIERVISHNRPLALLKRLDILVQAAAGLHHAHAKGILHRDIKPANIMLQADGAVKIMDFGVALLTQATADRITPQGSLIGTLPYMAPEQFFGSGPSVMTDIFAFGVTSYKLLTGTHPFQAPELGSMMHNIANREHPGIRTFNSKFPEALEQLINKLLTKNPDSRYQSLEDVQFDIEPIIIELRTANLGEMITETRNLIAAGQFETAQSVIRQVMEIDPANRTARELRDTILRQIKSKAIRPGVTVLVTAGRDHLAGRRFDEALREFESALRLDDANTELRGLVEQARAAAERAGRAHRLLDEARQALQRDDLTGAHRNAVEAVEADPDQDHAEDLLREIRQRIDGRRRERALSEGLNHIRGLIAMESYRDAIASAKRLQQDFQEVTEIGALLERARRESEEQARRARCQAAIAEVKRSLKDRRFADALQQLARVQAQFPEAAEVPDLISYTTAELVAETRAQTIARATAETRSLASAAKFDTALERLQSALTEDPGLHELRDLMQSVAVQKSEHQRRTALHDTVKRGTDLCRKGRFAESLECLNAFVRACGDDPALGPVRKLADDGLERQRKAAAAQALVAERRPEIAIFAKPRATSKRFFVAGGIGLATVAAGIALFPSGPSAPRLPSPIIEKPVNKPAPPPQPQPQVEIKPEPPQIPLASASGTLQVRTGVAGATLYVDGVARARTDQSGSVTIRVEARTHDLRVQLTGYQAPPAQRVKVVAGQNHTVSLVLAPEVSAIQPQAPTPVEVKAGHTDPPPVGAPVNPETIENRDWERVRGTSDLAQLRSFLASHPNGAHAREAISRIADLAWNPVDQTNPDAVRRFIKENPENPHANLEARSILQKLEAEQQRQLDQDRLRQEQSRKQQIAGVLHQLDSALQRKRLADVKSLWPGVSPLFLEALKNGRVEMSLSVEDVQLVQGQENAAVRCVLVTRNRNGSTPPRSQKGVVQLRNSGGNWVIETARFD